MPKNSGLTALRARSGFTLIELMVVIAIITILSLVGLVTFNGAQAAARDGRRRVEIDQLAKNIETIREPTTKDYLYDNTTAQKDYPNGLTDPGSYVYCYQASINSTPPANPANWQSSTCPESWLSIGGSPFTVAAIAGPDNDLTDPGIRSYTVCASAERGSNVICKSNVLR